MKRTSLFKKNYEIELSNVDFKKKLKISSLFSFFQDIASDASLNLGLGIDELEKQYGVAWVLVKIRVDIARIPNWHEEITIETWPITPKTLEFERDFIVKDRDGNAIVRAISTWVIIDLNTRKIRKSDVLPTNYPEIITERALDVPFSRLKPYNKPDIAYKKVIGYSDIDFNGHLNNSRYIDYIVDCFSIENHKIYSVKSIEVNFNNEALPGDTLTLYKDVSLVSNNLIYIEGINEKDNKITFKANLTITEDGEE